MQRLKYIFGVLGICVLLIVGILAYFVFFHKPTPDGFDLSKSDNWYLPQNSQSKATGGYFDYWTDQVKPIAESVELSWKEISPTEGVFDWSQLKSKLATAKQNGRKIWLRIYMTDQKLVPDWVKTKYPNLPNLNYGEYEENLTGSSPGVFYPLWDKGFEQEIRLLVQDLAKQNIVSDPSFAFLYVPFGWRWNEYEFKFGDELEKIGFSPKTYLEWLKQHLEIFTKNFAGFENKLMFTGNPNMDYADGSESWIRGLNDLKTGRSYQVDIAINLGMSVRLGNLEYFNVFSNIPSWGYPAEKIGDYYYQVKDPEHPLVKDPNRLIGSENEGIGDNSMLFGTKDYYFARMNTLKALQIGVNWLNIQAVTYDLAPEVFEYARKEMGKTPSQQSDCWVSLREWKDLSLERFRFLGKENLPFDPDIPFRNFEKGLHQRELEGGKTIATNFVGDPKATANFNPFYFYNGSSYEAIRTDKNTQNNAIYFQTDQSCKSQTDRYKLGVTFLDDSEGEFRLEYYDTDNKLQSKSIPKNNTKAWKTEMLNLDNLNLNQGFIGKNDFRLINDNKSDLTLTLVRLIKES